MVTDEQKRRLCRELCRGETLVRACQKAGMSEKTGRKWRGAGPLPGECREPRTWRTREDPFAEVWPELAELGRFSEGQLRTLQRRVREWRQVMARKLVYACLDADEEGAFAVVVGAPRIPAAPLIEPTPGLSLCALPAVMENAPPEARALPLPCNDPVGALVAPQRCPILPTRQLEHSMTAAAKQAEHKHGRSMVTSVPDSQKPGHTSMPRAANPIHPSLRESRD